MICDSSFTIIRKRAVMEIIELKGAKEFVNGISLDNSIFETPYSNYVFRGQSNYEWEIIPSAFRDRPRIFNEYGFLKNVGERTNREQVEAEVITPVSYTHLTLPTKRIV